MTVFSITKCLDDKIPLISKGIKIIIADGNSQTNYHPYCPACKKYVGSDSSNKPKMISAEEEALQVAKDIWKKNYKKEDIKFEEKDYPKSTFS